MNLEIQQIRLQPKILKLSAAWVNLFEFVQAHPFVKFEHLEFANGDPKIGTQDVKVTQSHKF